MVTNTNNNENNILKGYNMLLYFAGSMIMYEPSEECITDFWTQGILKNLPVSSSNPNFIKAASQLRESCVDKSVCSKMMHEDYIRLFGKGQVPLASAYESLYNNKMNPDTGFQVANVTDFYNSYGWVSKFKGRINDDHLGIELLFLTLLIDKYLLLDDEACQREMRGEILRFIALHIMSWVSEWNDKIQANAKTLCYKGIGSLIYSCVEDIHLFLEQRTLANDKYGTLKNQG